MGFFDIKRYDLGIYTLIVFGLLFLILAKFAWGPFNEGLAKREATIREARDEALKAKADAEEVQKELQGRVRRRVGQDSGDDGRSPQGRRRAAGQGTRSGREGSGRRTRTGQAGNRSREGRRPCRKSTRSRSKLAALMSSKAISRNMTADDHSRLIDEALADLKTSVSQGVSP